MACGNEEGSDPCSLDGISQLSVRLQIEEPLDG